MLFSDDTRIPRRGGRPPAPPPARPARPAAPRAPAPNTFDARRHDYAGTHRDILQAGRWVAVPREWLAVLTPSQGLVIAHLVSTGAHAPSPGGWIMATTKFLQSGVGLSPERQEQVLRSLCEMGIAEVRNDVRKARHVRINLTALRALLAGVRK